MAVRFDGILNKLLTKYVKTAGDTMTGNLAVSKADPELKLTDTGDSEYTRVTRTDTSGKATRYNRVTEPPDSSDFTKYRAVTVTIGDNIDANYSLDLTFDHAAMVTGGANADGSDCTVFYDAIGDFVGSQTEIDRTLDPESAWNGTATKVWFKLQANLTDNDSTHYRMYYKKDSHTPAADADNVFDLYDDFASYDTAKWTDPQPGSASISSETLHLTGNNSSVVVESNSTFAPGHACKARIKENGGTYGWYTNDRIGFGDVGLNSSMVAFMLYDDPTVLRCWGGGWHADATGISWTDDTWHTAEVKYVGTASAKWYWDNGAETEKTTDLPDMTENMVFRCAPGDAFQQDFYIDWAYVRDIVASEPTQGLGSETAVSGVVREIPAWSSEDGSTYGEHGIQTVGGTNSRLNLKGKSQRFFIGTSEKVRIGTSGNVGFGVTSPTAKVDINSDILRLRTSKTPGSVGAAGSAGDICWDADYVYVCTATDTWKRTAIGTW